MFQSRTKFNGMYSLRKATELPLGWCAYSLNSNLGSSSEAAPMKGYSVFGHQTNSGHNIIRKYTYCRSDGTEIMLQVRDNATNYIIEYLNREDVRNSQDGEWSILEAGLSRSRVLQDGSTKKAWFDFAPFNDTGTNQCVYGNGVETMRIWNGATGKIASSTVNTIVLSGTATLAQRGFSATGSLIINGTTYTYTGLSGQTFTGVGTDPTGEAIGSGVAQAVDSSTLSGEDACAIILSTQARLFTAGITATPNQVNFSDVGDITSWAGSNPDDGGFEDFPQMNGEITALSYIDEWIIVFSEKHISAFKFDFPSSTTRTVLRKDIADEGCSNPKAVRKLGDQVWYITPHGGIKRITQIASENVFNVEDLTDKIRPTIKNFIWDDACLTYSTKDRVFFAAGKSSSDMDVNDKAVNIWLALNENNELQVNLGLCDWFIGDMCEYEGDLHFGSSVQSEDFKAFDGYSKNGNSYIWKRTERIELFDEIFERKFVKFLGLIGSIAVGTTLYITLKYDLNGKTTKKEMKINGTDEGFVVQQPLNTLGGFELGTEPLGGTMDEIGDLNPFEVVFEFNEPYPRSVQLELSTDGAGQQVAVDLYSYDVYSADEHIYSTEIKEIGI